MSSSAVTGTRGRAHPWIAREGWGHVAIAFAAAVLATAWFGWPAFPLWIVALFVLQFFRDPERTPLEEAGAIVCPADGRVISVGLTQDPYLARRALKISIFMNVFNVHSNKSPVSGTVQKCWYRAGSFFNAALDKASERNESNALWLRTESGRDVVVVQIAGLLARRILCYVGEGDALEPGSRYGFIRFGSRVDLYLPPEAVARVALGDKVVGGHDIAAILGQSEGP